MKLRDIADRLREGTADRREVDIAAKALDAVADAGGAIEYVMATGDVVVTIPDRDAFKEGSYLDQLVRGKLTPR